MKIRTLAILLVLMMAALVLVPASAATADAADPVNKAVITFQPSQQAGDDCVKQDEGLLDVFGFKIPWKGHMFGLYNGGFYTTVDAPDSFKVIIRRDIKLCEPIHAKAAVYAMPSTQWPQQLVSVETYTIQAAGTYTITFPKTCLAQQFDVLTGATPQTISPTGPWHGPLIFNGIYPWWVPASAIQWWGFPCVTPTTTVPPTTSSTTTTTTVPPTTSTTTTTTVAPTTTSTSTTTTSTTAPPVTVEGTVVTRPGYPGDPGDPGDPGVQVAGITTSRLPVTGSGSDLTMLFGLVLVLSGFSLALATRKRKGLLG